MKVINLLKDALQGKFKFTYANTGKEVEKPEDLINILNAFAQLDILVNSILNESKTTRTI